MSKKIHLVLPAAGSGSRMQSDRPKQYLPLGDKWIIQHTIDRLKSMGVFATIMVVVAKDDPYWPNAGYESDAEILTCEGGTQRCFSVLNGLFELGDNVGVDDIVLVHDVARPLVDLQDIHNLLSADLSQGGLLAIRASDTLKKSDASDRVVTTIDRENVWRAATPQAAPYGVLRKALENAISQGYEVTDEASALELDGLSPLLIDSSPLNIKLTTPSDLSMAEKLIRFL